METSSAEETTEGEIIERGLEQVRDSLRGAFSPRVSIARTPPKMTETGKPDRLTKKRKQESPIYVSPRERSTTTYLDTVKRELKSIKEATSKEGGGKIQFNKGEQVKVRDSMVVIQQVVTDMVYRIGVLEGKLGDRREEGDEMGGSRENRDEILARLESEVEKSREIERNIADTLNKQWELMKEVREGLRKEKALGDRKEGKLGIHRKDTRDRSGKGGPTETDTDRETIRVSDKERDSVELDSETDHNEVFEVARERKRRKKKKGDTYASILGSKEIEIRPTASTRPEREPWSTPPPINRNKVELKLVDTEGTRNKLNKVKEILRTGEKVGPVRNILELPNKNMLVLCEDINQKTKICDKLKGRKDVELREDRNIQPTFKITGVDAGSTPNEVRDELLKWNPDVFGQGDELDTDAIKVVTKRTCMDPRRENWIVEAKPETFKLIMRKGRLEIDASLHRVEEHVSPALCFRCCIYGHVQKYCKAETPICYKCAGDHDGKDCRSERKECANCKKGDIEPRDHTARSWVCPIMRRKMEVERRLVDYGGGQDATTRPTNE